jgi:MFS family permease
MHLGVDSSAALANPGFRRLWIAQGISIFGDYLAMFAVQSAIVFRMRGSAREVSAVLLVSLVPGILIGPFAGVFADRCNHPRRTHPLQIMVTSDILRAVLVLLLAVSLRVPPGASAPVLVRICSICFAISCVSAVFAPAQAVVIPRLVKGEELLSASVLLQQSMHIARIASPVAAGALVARFGDKACYAADAASFVFSAVMLAGIPGRAARVNFVRTPVHLTCELRAGLDFVRAHSEVCFATLAMAAGTFAAGCFSALAAIYVRDALRAGSGVYGAIGSLTAAGTLVGSLTVGKFANRFARRTLIATGMGVVGACIFSLALFPSLRVALLGALGIGCGAAIAMIAASAVLKECTPGELRGRVSSVSTAWMSAAQAAALILAGSLAARIGVRGVYALSGAMLLAQPVYRCFRRGTSRSVPSACFQIPR